jgi:hypothetical protein
MRCATPAPGHGAHHAGDIIRHLCEFVSKNDNYIEIFDLDRLVKDVITFI